MFFGLHSMTIALVEIILLEATIIALSIFIFDRSKIASVLLMPYALWIFFLIYLTNLINLLNLR